MTRKKLPFIGGPSDQYCPAEIPKGWTWVKLCDVARLESGHTPDRKQPEYWNGKIKWVSLQDTGRLNGNTISTTAYEMTKQGITNSSARILPAGTVIFSRTATVGKSTILGCDMATSQDFANYVCGDDLLNLYLVYAFRGMGRTWKSLMAGSTHNAIYMPNFKKLRILLPPLPEQQKIAAILSTWDRAIELTEKLIAAKQKRKQALMQQLLTGKVRLPGFEKTTWKKCHLGDVAKNSSRRNGLPTDQPTMYSVTNSVGMIPIEEGVIGESIDRYKTVSRFDFAYNPMRINVGSISMWEGGEDVLVSPDYVVFRCGSKLDAEFLNDRKRHKEYSRRWAA